MTPWQRLTVVLSVAYHSTGLWEQTVPLSTRRKWPPLLITVSLPVLLAVCQPCVKSRQERELQCGSTKGVNKILLETEKVAGTQYLDKT